MYRTVTDLTRGELTELKVNFLFELADCGAFSEVMHRDYDEPAYNDIANADDLIDDECIYTHYADISFTEDDFFCNQTERSA